VTETNRWRRALTCVALSALLLSVAAVGTVDAGTIWIQWDRSPDPAVAGYRVSVGTEPGVYTETFDVGQAATFMYQAPDARVYYLAVASYTAGPLVGPLSEPVSALPADLAPIAAAFAPSDAHSFYEFLWRNVAAAPAAGGLSSGAATTSRWRRARTLFFIEDGQRIGVITSNVLQPQPVLVSDDPDVQLTQVLPDADFASTGLIYVGETGPSRDGGRELRIVRYRVDQNRAVEPDLVATVLLPAVGEALFSITSSGELSVRLMPVESR
jgi:hypothetical protein